ncbi:MAG: FkbM family methyltransferase, partial [Rhodospirillaceae bacterium]|nr:FkbM family methyltransferase [Rhodospirillaceae bacterium]
RERFAAAINAGKLKLGTQPVNAENINQITAELGVPDEIDLLSIDIDGNDYHVFKAMERVRARVVVLEYNPLYAPPLKVVMAYDPNYAFNENTYMGASLQSITDLAESKGYRLVGCSVAGVNAIFVRADLAVGKFSEPATAEALYHPPKYQLSFSGGFGFGPKSNITALSEPKF